MVRKSWKTKKWPQNSIKNILKIQITNHKTLLKINNQYTRTLNKFNSRLNNLTQSFQIFQPHHQTISFKILRKFINIYQLHISLQILNWLRINLLTITPIQLILKPSLTFEETKPCWLLLNHQPVLFLISIDYNIFQIFAKNDTWCLVRGRLTT